jgi:hypothetical protein
MTSRTITWAAALGLTAGLALSSQNAYAWGHQAHAAIDEAAIARLPADGPVFLQDYAKYIAASATIPDSWRSPSEPFSKMEEDPNHGWFRERFAFLKSLPRSRYAFVLAVYRENQRLKRSDPEAASHMNVRGTGLLAYAVMEQYGHLVADMRQLRAARLAGKADDARFLEQTCAENIVRLGHYIGDGSQPLHDTINSDGWIGADPQGYTRDPAIHSRFESKYVKAIGLSVDDVEGHMEPIGHRHGDLFDEVLALLDHSGDQMERVYLLDKRGAFADPADASARALVYERVGAGASMLRDVIDRAWREAVQQPEVGGGNSLGPRNSEFDPETGSAPAPSDPR